jgi:mannosyl-3-phosphoglycerate phosphatase
MSQESTKNLIIFTDLDGTLLDAHTYAFEPAIPALQLLKENHIPLIICSSKTRKEIEYYRKKLDNHHPFISENGGGIFIPKDYFEFDIQLCNPPTPPFNSPLTKGGYRGVKGGLGGFSEDDDYHVIRLGAKYSELRRVIMELQKEGFLVKGFGDMTAEELVDIANMSIEDAVMAKERDFDEPFIFKGNEKEMQKLFESIKAKGFNFTRGRFYHIIGDSDKGKAVSILIELYKKFFNKIITVALGDNINDIPMLAKVNYPVLVQKPDGSYDQKINIPGIIKADGIGPSGWNRAINSLLDNLLFRGFY